MSLLERLESRKKNESALTGKLGERVKPASSFRTDPFQSLKSKIHKRIVGELGMADLERIDGNQAGKSSTTKILRNAFR